MLMLAAVAVVALLGVIAFYAVVIDARLRALARLLLAASDLNVAGHKATQKTLDGSERAACDD